MAVHARYIGHRLNPVAIRHVFRDQDGPVGQELDRDARLVLNQARRLVRVRTGRLIASGRIEAGIGGLGPYRDVTFGVPGITDYLDYEHDGTSPHVIRPRRRKVLRFIWHGRVVYAHRVNHPGTSGSRFLTRALDVLR